LNFKGIGSRLSPLYRANTQRIKLDNIAVCQAVWWQPDGRVVESIPVPRRSAHMEKWENMNRFLDHGCNCMRK
jgi:hypothetical protein